MIIWFGQDNSLSIEIRKKMNLLYSYYYVKNKKGFPHPELTKKFFLDSGAFSALTQNKKIDIEAYMSFIKKYEEKIAIYACLDVIGDARLSMFNQRIMDSNGFNSLPCFHYGEDFKYLKKYVDNYEYIALGGCAKLQFKNTLIPWLDEVFSKYISKDTKVHGYAITDSTILHRYSWESVDSMTAIYAGGMGEIVLPFKNELWRFCISNQNINSSKNHINVLPPLAKKIVLEKIEEKGFTLDELNISHQKRKEINVLFFMDLQEELTIKNEGKPRNIIHKKI